MWNNINGEMMNRGDGRRATPVTDRHLRCIAVSFIGLKTTYAEKGNCKLEILKHMSVRLILFNQFKMLSLLDKESEISYNYYMDILVQGIRKKYPIVLEAVDPQTEEVSEEVSDELDLLLDIFNKVQRSVNMMDNGMQKHLKENYHIDFDGFDYKNEIEKPYFTYYCFLKRYYNSNLPIENRSHDRLSLAHYREMIRTYLSSDYTGLLNARQVADICIPVGGEQTILNNSVFNIKDKESMMVSEDKAYQKD